MPYGKKTIGNYPLGLLPFSSFIPGRSCLTASSHF